MLSGKETIFYNGNLVSSKYTLFGTKHNFVVLENDHDTEYVIVIGFKNLLRIGFDIFRDGKALLLF